MSIEDVFKGVTFESARLDVSGQTAPAMGQPADSPTATPGQPVVPPTTQEPSKETAKPETDKQEPAPKEKPAPYDQDPKWKKARAAEAKLQALKEKYGVLEDDEIDRMLESHKELKAKIGDRNPDELLQAETIAKQIRADKLRTDAEKARTEGSPDEYIAKLEKQVQQLQESITEDKQTRQAREESQRILQEYTSTADKIIDVMTEDAPVSQDERGFLRLLMGIDNPINQMDLMDKPTLQKEMRTNIGKFTKYLQTVKAKAVEDYVAGKKPVVPDSAAGPAPGAQNIQPAKQPLDAKLSIDQVFGQGKNELLNLIMQAAKETL